MCSIGGFISEKGLQPDRALKLAEALLHYGSARGNQSAGVFVDGITLKRAVSADAFIDGAEFGALFAHDKPVNIVLTHTRQPTCGGLGDAQAQPFTHGKVASVHNGMIDPDIMKQWNIKKPSGVDSELIATFVAQYGPHKLGKFIGSTTGPSAVAVYHDGSVYLMRSGNPLYTYSFGLDNGDHVTVFGSTSYIVERAACNVWLMSPGMNANSIDENQLYKATPKTIQKIGKPIPVRLECYGMGFGLGYSHHWPDTDKLTIRHEFGGKKRRGKRTLNDELKGMGYEFSE